MKMALALGRRGLGRVWPNPAVGCVIVRDERIIGRGITQVGGRPHAEVVALNQAGDLACGATVYVTLEPCSHTGQTPPCASALIAAGVARVVVAMQDPDPRVSGRGIAMLRDAGIDVITDVLADEAGADHAGFVRRVTRGRPMVTLKLASSFDGRIATGAGESRWITGPVARRYVHGMRSNHDAVLVGAGTARQDDPSLTVRDMGVVSQPVRVVVSSRLNIPLDGALARTAGEVPVWVCHGEVDTARKRAWEQTGARMLPCAHHGAQIDVTSVLEALGAAGITRVFCEGGSALAASLLAADLVDRLVGFSAGVAIGAEGLPSIGAMGVAHLSDAPRFTLSDLRQVGDDVLHHWVRK